MAEIIKLDISKLTDEEKAIMETLEKSIREKYNMSLGEYLIEKAKNGEAEIVGIYCDEDDNIN